jgi:LysR family transcriptional regulator, cys regulon transcriptional activator
MNLQQLRYLSAVVENRFNLTGAASTVHTSQPGVSTQLRQLERELGIDLLVRKGNRITGLTEAGKEALRISRRVLGDVQNLRTLGTDYSVSDRGELVVGVTHIHERYWLLPVILRFGKEYPNVVLRLLRGTLSQVLDMVVDGSAHLGISTISGGTRESLIMLPCHTLHRSVFVPRNHPLTRKKRLTLADIARYPLIINTAAFSGGWNVLRILEAHSLKPHVVLHITDTEVIKICVAQNIGITVLPTKVLDPVQDAGIQAIDVSNMFEPMKSCVVLQRNYYLRQYESAFIQMFAPQWNRAAIDKAVQADNR